jgi:hypothetical protein
MELLSRLGYVAHGAVYIFIGALAARLAWGMRGKLADPPSAIRIIGDLPGGGFLTAFMAAGLVSYAMWRFVQAIADPDCQGRTVKGVIVRVGRVVSGVGYTALAFLAFQLAAATGQSAEPESNWAYRLLTEPVGAVLGALTAVIVLCVASDDVRKACTTNFGERLKHHEMSPAVSLAGRCAGSWGFAARAVVFTFGGIYLMRAVFENNPGRAKGFEGILASFLEFPHGTWILGLVALGLAAYGVFMVQAGLYRRHPF